MLIHGWWARLGSICFALHGEEMTLEQIMDAEEMMEKNIEFKDLVIKLFGAKALQYFNCDLAGRSYVVPE